MSMSDRMDAYENNYQYKLVSKLPVVIRINGRGFSKLTSLLEKPYDSYLSTCMLNTMNALCIEVGGAVLGYSFNDEIIIVSKNDNTAETEPWYDNNLQKIVSSVSSIATLQFVNNCLISKLEINGTPCFTTNAFVLPNNVEVANYLIHKQFQNLQTSVYFACYYELLRFYSKNKIKHFLTGLSLEDKIELLKTKCDIDFNQYPTVFRLGADCHRVSKDIDGQMKNKWEINKDVPLYVDNMQYILNILKG